MSQSFPEGCQLKAPCQQYCEQQGKESLSPKGSLEGNWQHITMSTNLSILPDFLHEHTRNFPLFWPKNSILYILFQTLSHALNVPKTFPCQYVDSILSHFFLNKHEVSHHVAAHLFIYLLNRQNIKQPFSLFRCLAIAIICYLVYYLDYYLVRE